jgi:very-short-patch-repair endonuclease
MSPRAKSVKPLTAHALKVRRNQEGERLKRKLFLALCEQEHIPAPTPEYQFAAPDRKFAFDFAWPFRGVALEVEGGIWTRGAHMRGRHALSDMEKYNLAAIRGWKVLRVTPDQLLTTETITMLAIALGLNVIP